METKGLFPGDQVAYRILNGKTLGKRPFSKEEDGSIWTLVRKTARIEAGRTG
jgi:hypothetical protein